MGAVKRVAPYMGPVLDIRVHQGAARVSERDKFLRWFWSEKALMGVIQNIHILVKVA